VLLGRERCGYVIPSAWGRISQRLPPLSARGCGPFMLTNSWSISVPFWTVNELDDHARVD